MGSKLCFWWVLTLLGDSSDVVHPEEPKMWNPSGNWRSGEVPQPIKKPTWQIPSAFLSQRSPELEQVMQGSFALCPTETTQTHHSHQWQKEAITSCDHFNPPSRQQPVEELHNWNSPPSQPQRCYLLCSQTWYEGFWKGLVFCSATTEEVIAKKSISPSRVACRPRGEGTSWFMRWKGRPTFNDIENSAQMYFLRAKLERCCPWVHISFL